MIFYLCNGNELAATQADAKKLDRNFEQVDIPTDKAGLMSYINRLMSAAEVLGIGPVRGIDGPFDMDDAGQPITDIPMPVEPAKPSYIERSISLDDEWEKLSLARKLHFGALALEEARLAL
jgi:hypothetical protein